MDKLAAPTLTFVTSVLFVLYKHAHSIFHDGTENAANMTYIHFHEIVSSKTESNTANNNTEEGLLCFTRMCMCDISDGQIPTASHPPGQTSSMWHNPQTR